MMSVEQQAQALADWLADNPGAEPPAGVDTDVIEAVYSLRPDLAPAPRVSMDDILGMVSSGPLAAPAIVAAPIETAPAKKTVVSTVPQVVSTPTPANNNRRLWAVLGGVAAMAAAVLVTVQVSMTAGQGTFAPTASEPTAAAPQTERVAAPVLVRPQGAAGQVNQAEGGEVAGSPSVGGSIVLELDAVADLGEPTDAQQDEVFQFALNEDAGDDFMDDLAEEPQRGEEQSNESLTGLVRDRVGERGAGLASDQGVDRARGTSDNGRFGGEGQDVNQIVSRPSPNPMAAPSPEQAVEPAVIPTSVAGVPPPDVLPSPDALDLVSVGMADDFFEAAVANADVEDDEEDIAWDEAPETLSMDSQLEARALDSVAVSESTGSRRDPSRSQDQRRGRRTRAPQAAAAPAEQQAPAPPVLVESAPESEPIAHVVSGQVRVDAGVVQAQERARELAARQQYSAAFETLSAYISPSAPVDVVLDATEYAFAAGRWADTVRVASIRLDANVPLDSAQSRSRLYDFRARAQAMLDE